MTAADAPAPPAAGRWELFRALGAVAGDPADARTACAALGWAGPGNAEHTEVFVLNCPPYASVYLGAEGGLGGDAADRAAGFWRAIGLAPPAEPDHLAALFGLYASLGEAAGDTRTAATANALTRARHALFWEHLWSWLPGYLDAVADLQAPGLASWARLAGRALLAERGARGQAAPGEDETTADRAGEHVQHGAEAVGGRAWFRRGAQGQRQPPAGMGVALGQQCPPGQERPGRQAGSPQISDGVQVAGQPGPQVFPEHGISCPGSSGSAVPGLLRVSPAAADSGLWVVLCAAPVLGGGPGPRLRRTGPSARPERSMAGSHIPS